MLFFLFHPGQQGHGAVGAQDAKLGAALPGTATDRQGLSLEAGLPVVQFQLPDRLRQTLLHGAAAQQDAAVGHIVQVAAHINVGGGHGVSPQLRRFGKIRGQTGARSRASNDLTYTKRVLEMGPDGIIFPMVRSAEEAETLLSCTLYPPYGSRGCGPQRAVRYGFDNEAAYVRSRPMDLCRFLQIESKAFI